MIAKADFLEFKVECLRCRRRRVLHAPDPVTAVADAVACGWAEVGSDVPAPVSPNIWMYCVTCKEVSK